MMATETDSLKTSSEMLAEGLAAAMLADDKWEEEHRGFVGISELGRCPRAAWLRLHEVPRTNLPPVEGEYFKLMGTLKHDKLGKLMNIPYRNRAKRHTRSQGEVNGVPLLGHPDAIYQGVVREWKTTSEGGVAFPREVDELQVAGYMLLRRMPGELFYKCDNGNEATFRYQRPPDFAVERIEWATAHIAAATATEQVPCARRYCASCRWRDLCEPMMPTAEDVKAWPTLDIEDLVPAEQSLFARLADADVQRKRNEAICEELKPIAEGIMETREVRVVEHNGAEFRLRQRKQKRVDTDRVRELLGEQTPYADSVSQFVQVVPGKAEVNGE